MEYFKYKIILRKLWKFIGGNFEILKLDKITFNQECLHKEFNINVNNEILEVFWEEFSNKFEEYATFGSLFNDYIYTEIKQCCLYLSCKQIICMILLKIVKNKLDPIKYQKIDKPLNKWKLELNIEEDKAKAIIKYNKDNHIEEDDEKYGIENVINKPIKGRWRSWSEIELKSNHDIENIIYPMLMTDIIFSEFGHFDVQYLSQSLKNWNNQREIFGKKFLELFNKNDKEDRIRAFWCKDIAWDLDNKDPLSGDKILCCIDNKKIVAVWSLIGNLYR